MDEFEGEAASTHRELLLAGTAGTYRHLWEHQSGGSSRSERSLGALSGLFPSGARSSRSGWFGGAQTRPKR
jgi:hypothetical protein